MAFSRTGINPIGGQSNELSVGDVIFVHDSNTPTLSIVMVASNASSVVDITDGTTVAMTDSD
jgi:hypothetical protein